MISPKELTKWLKTIPKDAILGIDAGGLTLIAEMDLTGNFIASIDIGGTLSENMEQDDWDETEAIREVQGYAE
jgi:hypothetical protein